VAERDTACQTGMTATISGITLMWMKPLVSLNAKMRVKENIVQMSPTHANGYCLA